MITILQPYWHTTMANQVRDCSNKHDNVVLKAFHAARGRGTDVCLNSAGAAAIDPLIRVDVLQFGTFIAWELLSYRHVCF